MDLGTFGGPNSFISTSPLAKMLTNSGMVVGIADTSTLEPLGTTFDGNADNAFLWKDGVLHSLGTLPGGLSSFGYALNELGVVIGQSENGKIDALIGLPELHAVVWLNGHIVDLGSFGGNESNPADINLWGQVVGGALNSIPDPFANGFAERDTVLPGHNAITRLFVAAGKTARSWHPRWSGQFRCLDQRSRPDRRAIFYRLHAKPWKRGPANPASIFLGKRQDDRRGDPWRRIGHTQ